MNSIAYSTQHSVGQIRHSVRTCVKDRTGDAGCLGRGGDNHHARNCTRERLGSKGWSLAQLDIMPALFNTTFRGIKSKHSKACGSIQDQTGAAGERDGTPTTGAPERTGTSWNRGFKKLGTSKLDNIVTLSQYAVQRKRTIKQNIA
ncbi:hypothetical protein TNIN_257601 [Trichonephila inaurata madagascariensis]|uniref:Uncharacterized protein n=1 Tax=Trichonephila inaurata madagascariensis TaxID=2747483 RepID=A0A8X6XCQ0_9ARAC|nr:hypothetical protein TNIN_257601 [Trichonephila inaurata madagascariensis]